MTARPFRFGVTRWDTALEHLQRAEQTDGGNPRVHVFMGQVFLRLRRWSDARRAFQNALELEPNHAEALCGLSVVELRQRNAQAAVEHALAAIESYEPMPTAHYYLGVALIELGRYSQAAMALERALSLNPHLSAARRRLLRLYEGVLNEPEGAAQHRRQAEELRLQRRMSRCADAASDPA